MVRQTMEAMMRRPIWQLAGLVLAATLPAANACAQIEGLLGKGGKAGDLKGMAGLASSPLSSGSMSNVAGLLQYCIGNGQLSEQGAGPVKDQLMAKLPGGAKSGDRGYSDGLKGVLHGSNGNLVDLSSGGGGIAGIGSSAGGSAGSGTGTGGTGGTSSMGSSGSTGSSGSSGSSGSTGTAETGTSIGTGSTGTGTGTGTGGLTADLTKKACDTILAQAKSFL
jgi:hypothetical protein